MKSFILNSLSTQISPRTCDIGLLLLRLGLAFGLINTHGIKKVLHLSETVEKIPDPFQLGGTTSTIIAILANIVFAVFLALGLFTRASALFILGVTLTGLFMVHLNDPWAIKDVPYTYSVVLTVITLLGAGSYSLDKSLSKKLM